MKRKNFQNSKISQLNQCQCKTMSLSDNVRVKSVRTQSISVSDNVSVTKCQSQTMSGSSECKTQMMSESSSFQSQIILLSRNKEYKKNEFSNKMKCEK